MVIHISVVGTSTTPDPAKIAEAIGPLLDSAAVITTINIDVEPVAYTANEVPQALRTGVVPSV